MSTDQPQPSTPQRPAPGQQPTGRRPYAKPEFIPSLAFERGSLSCGSNLSNQGPPFGSCALQS